VVSWTNRPKSSKPTHAICEWLAAVFLLRDIAVANRRIRTDIYQRVLTADTQHSDDEIDEEDNNNDLPVTTRPDAEDAEGAQMEGGSIEKLERIDLADK
jgi:hypothetical protein